jgi:hypothetical protein
LASAATAWIDRSSCAALVAALAAESLIDRPFAATAWMERDICSTAVEFWSTDVISPSVIALTCSIEAAISLIDDEVCSAAAARSVALPATPVIDRDICSIAAAV